ncbi:hypothetical protein B9Z19DRAFT_1124501 [Tuber borchii]|uniref:Uncharacterized protein n=1 Tax=Tuber borchii TaxID=42251 RepID=A0A2T6ZWL2_TUBBO|nr:hypothetical protein B9Z19DRAFT_1124501 [Tuber borchii]
MPPQWNSPSNTPTSFASPSLTHPATTNIKALSSDIVSSSLSQWQLQVICGPGHDYNNFDSQRPGIKFKLFEHIGEQIWRPSLLILDEVVNCPTNTTSLDWPDILRFRVLDNTTPWEQWSSLYSKEHYGRKPLIRDCYLTHGWNKQTKSPIWLPREVQNSGSLRSILTQWFSAFKDKVTIVFEYINKDRVHSDGLVAERFSDLSLALSDHELLETILSDSSSPLPTLRSSSVYQPHISPSQSPTKTATTLEPTSAVSAPALREEVTTHDFNSPDPVPKSQALGPILNSSSDFEFPTIQQLIVTTTPFEEDDSPILASITLHPQICELASSLLSTILDSPEIASPPIILLPSNSTTGTAEILVRSASKAAVRDYEKAPGNRLRDVSVSFSESRCNSTRDYNPSAARKAPDDDRWIEPRRCLRRDIRTDHGTGRSEIKTRDDCFDVDMSFGTAAASRGAMSGLGGGNRIFRLQCGQRSLNTDSVKLLPRACCGG